MAPSLCLLDEWRCRFGQPTRKKFGASDAARPTAVRPSVATVRIRAASLRGPGSLRSAANKLGILCRIVIRAHKVTSSTADRNRATSGVQLCYKAEVAQPFSKPIRFRQELLS